MNRVDVKFALILLAICLLLSSNARAATINAATCSRGDVQSAINSALPGDTVVVPSGTATWASEIAVNKDLSIIGAGSANTKITRSSGDCFSLDNAHTIRISGFGFTNCTFSATGEAAAGTSFRIDHNSFTSTSWQENLIHGGCQTPMRHPTGLIDNNTFHNYRAALVYGTNCLISEGSYQHQLWAQTPPKGDGNGIIYVEDNIISGDVHQNWVDGNQGARFIGRYNTVSGTTYAEIHSIQGGNRAVQWWEFYGNTYSKSVSDWYPVIYARGGSGMIFNNSASSNYTSDLILNNVRSCRDPGDGVGKCDGSSNWDQNTGGQYGWACRDQIGRANDTTLWSPGGAYAQPSTPAYFWNNIKGASTQLSINIDAGESCPGTGGDLNSSHIQANRDYYNYNASFNGTTGVGVGSLAARPATCTAGVAYWATDQGTWNKSGKGGQGVLYKCTSTNTWTLYYTPYTYPHPSQGGGGSLQPPQNLRIVQ